MKQLFQVQIVAQGESSNKNGSTTGCHSNIRLGIAVEDIANEKKGDRTITFECKTYEVVPKNSSYDWKKFFDCRMNGKQATISVIEGFIIVGFNESSKDWGLYPCSSIAICIRSLFFLFLTFNIKYV